MNKWIAISTMVVLLAGVGVVGYLYMQESDKLKDAESEIGGLQTNVSSLQTNVSTLQGTVSTLEGDVSTLEGDVSTLETELSTSQATVSSLETDLANTQNSLQAQEDINSELSGDLNTIRSPRHFSSLAELKAWLAQDDTNTAYAYKSSVERCFILQVRALRDGYILSAILYTTDGNKYVMNQAVIGNSIYRVSATNDYVYFFDTVSPVQPAYPLPLE